MFREDIIVLGVRPKMYKYHWVIVFSLSSDDFPVKLYRIAGYAQSMFLRPEPFDLVGWWDQGKKNTIIHLSSGFCATSPQEKKGETEGLGPGVVFLQGLSCHRSLHGAVNPPPPPRRCLLYVAHFKWMDQSSATLSSEFFLTRSLYKKDKSCIYPFFTACLRDAV